MLAYHDEINKCDTVLQRNRATLYVFLDILRYEKIAPATTCCITCLHIYRPVNTIVV